jgi:CpeT protein
MSRRFSLSILVASCLAWTCSCASAGESSDLADAATPIADSGQTQSGVDHDAGANEAGTHDAGGVESTVERLTRLLTGRFDSSAQAALDSNYFAVQLHTCAVSIPELGVHVLYVEQALMSSLGQPYRQRFYVLSSPSTSEAISAVYESTAPLALVGLCDDEAEVRAERTPAASTTFKLEGCDVLLEPTSEGFVGSTFEKACPTTFNGATYVTSEVTITEDRLLTWDRGYNDADVQVWGATVGPYEFVRQ